MLGSMPSTMVESIGDEMAVKETPKEAAIIGNIEKRLGPVGPGHHNSHRTAALLRWLKQHETKSGK